jgi:adenine/guanine phosphoribosyltransferase-like PRPP-binding protein
MPLKVVCCFSHRTSVDTTWTDEQHSVNQFVDAIKDRPIKGYGHVQLHGESTKREISSATRAQATGWFGQMAAQILNDHRVVRAILVPLPNSDCAVGVPASRTAALASAVASSSDAVVADILRWDQVWPSASEQGGTRDPAILYRRLTLVGRIQPGPCVLIDDVLTSGGHLRAAAHVLASLGADVVLAICAARADQEPTSHPFEMRIEEYEDFDPAH